MKHKCQEKEYLYNKYDYHTIRQLGYGEAIGEIKYSEEFKLWHTDNDEYASPINFCPFCGINLGKLIQDLENFDKSLKHPSARINGVYINKKNE